MQKGFIKRINILVLIIAILLSTINIESMAAETPRATQWSYSYTGAEDIYNVPTSGLYEFELAGAEGGSSNLGIGGKGGKVTFQVLLLKDTKLHINVGGKPVSNVGGYNGGGSSSGNNGAGGGATSISYSSGLLSSFASDKNKIFAVAGGGGGSYSTKVPNQDLL